MHPPTRSTFDIWIRKLDNRGFLSAEKFFEKRTTLYDAMPVFWKKLDVDHRQAVMGIICDAYNSTPLIKNVWRKQNILILSIFVRLEDVFKLRVCYITSKVDPSVIVCLEEEEFSNIQNYNASPIDQFHSWKPLTWHERSEERRVM